MKLVEYTEDFLDLSWEWLNDQEIKELTMTPDFTRQDQLFFFENIKKRQDYLIYGIEFDGVKIGVCGLKNITADMAEYWGYIGDKEYWGRGIGREIVCLCINLACDLKLRKLCLNVLKSNSRALSLYKNMGFESSRLDDVIYMEKEL